ncbi:MAG: ribosome recycling factor [Candidatus Paceibacterota bacterium]
MSYSFNEFKVTLSEAGEWLRRELSSIRTGQASPAILDSVTVDSYGSRMPINQVGTVTLEGPRALRVSVWDKNLIKAIEKAITEKDLGLSISSDDAGVRVFFPQVTMEQKEKFVKLAKDRLEEGRIRVRKERETVSSELQSLQKAGDASEDEVFRLKAEMQKLVDETNEKLNQHFERKEKEILST